jgi:hypothetical protein
MPTFFRARSDSRCAHSACPMGGTIAKGDQMTAHPTAKGHVHPMCYDLVTEVPFVRELPLTVEVPPRFVCANTVNLDNDAATRPETCRHDFPTNACPLCP